MKSLLLSASLVAAFVPPRAAAPSALRRSFFDQFIPDANADAELDSIVSSAKAVLLTEGNAAGDTVVAQLKSAKLTTYKEVNLKSLPNSGKLIGSLKRRVAAPPVLIVAGQVFDKQRIEYLVKQDMMLPVFRAAGTSGEVRLPFQDLRFYLSKTIK
mmetsp:Transcript_5738/g.16941  ORF Transcript_5738/g.16941 Transcript_5738/m.16941 type:complete len:156 (-) Transcript_5738:24-491(-)